MKNRGTYTLLALFFASLVGLWVADFAQIPTRKMRERMSKPHPPWKLLDTKPDDLVKIEILGGEEPLVFERKGGNRWQMTAPKDVAADPSMVETLAYNLKEELTRKPEAATLEGDRERFGLAPPQRTIRLWGASTDEPLASLEVGKVSLDRRYVRSTGSEGVEVVDARLLDLLKLLPIRWRDREMFYGRPFPIEVDAVNISCGRQGSRSFGEGATPGESRAVPRPLAADPKVDGLIADLGTLKVLDDSRFVANDVSDADLERYPGLRRPLAHPDPSRSMPAPGAPAGEGILRFSTSGSRLKDDTARSTPFQRGRMTSSSSTPGSSKTSSQSPTPSGARRSPTSTRPRSPRIGVEGMPKGTTSSRPCVRAMTGRSSAPRWPAG